MTAYTHEPAMTTAAIAGTGQRFPVRRIYCVGRNYAEHAREMGDDPEREAPFFFAKPADALCLADTVPFPPRTDDLHHEVELVVALASGGRDLPVDGALATVLGYGVGIDLTRRDLQREAKAAGRPWDTAKGFDGSALLGPLCPVAGVGHPQRGMIALRVNGEPRQRGDLSAMIWSVPEIIAELSTYFELRPGDLIFTGTPAGVGALEPGDLIEATIAGLPALAVTVVAARA